MSETLRDKKGHPITEGFYYRSEKKDIIYVHQNTGPNFYNWLYDEIILGPFNGEGTILRGQLESQKIGESIPILPISRDIINFIKIEPNLRFIKSRASQD